ncbi:hypothetical protein [Streptomyces albus]|nr:hypothetical protein [Streptomyces albus]
MSDPESIEGRQDRGRLSKLVEAVAMALSVSFATEIGTRLGQAVAKVLSL